MVAVDTSTFVAYFRGSTGPDVDFLGSLLAERTAILTPPVLSELLSEPTLARTTEQALLSIPVLSILEGYWERVGRLRRTLLAAGRRAKLADVLIAQCCIDHGVTLLSRDSDFESLARYSNLVLWQPAAT